MPKVDLYVKTEIPFCLIFNDKNTLYSSHLQNTARNKPEWQTYSSVDLQCKVSK